MHRRGGLVFSGRGFLEISWFGVICIPSKYIVLEKSQRFPQKLVTRSETNLGIVISFYYITGGYKRRNIIAGGKINRFFFKNIP